MLKVAITVATSAVLGLCTICVTVATNWITAVNSDRQKYHDAIRELQIRSEYVNGAIPAAPLTPIQK